MEHARLISIAQKVIHKFGKDRQLTLCCAVCSRAGTKQGRELNKGGVIKEIHIFSDSLATTGEAPGTRMSEASLVN